MIQWGGKEDMWRAAKNEDFAAVRDHGGDHFASLPFLFTLHPTFLIFIVIQLIKAFPDRASEEGSNIHH